MNKNELKEGEIYTFKSNFSGTTFLVKWGKDASTNLNIELNTNRPTLFENGYFGGYIKDIKEATPEEKHWLETCITADKFISYEEAMKSFIPEYVELLPGFSANGEFVGKIFNTKIDFQSQVKDFKYISVSWNWEFLLKKNWYPRFFKPSIKEAYDAQFKIKEVVKVKPFEILSFRGLKKTNSGLFTKNKNETYRYKDTESFYELETFLKNLDDLVSINSVINEEGNIFMIGDTITPSIRANKGKGFKITGFRLNKDKSMICAITDTHKLNGIGIDKIEHFIEKDEFVLPENWYVTVTKENEEILNRWRFGYYKAGGATLGQIVGMSKQNITGMLSKEHNPINLTRSDTQYGYNFGNEITFDQFKKYALKEEVKSNLEIHNEEVFLPQSIHRSAILEETLLEKAKRLYPIGTKFKSPITFINATVIFNHFTEEEDRICLDNGNGYSSKGTWTIYDKKSDTWAKIIEDKPKVGDKFEFIEGHWRRNVNNVKVISRIFENSVAFNIKYRNNDKFYSGGTILLKNIKIIK